MGPIIVVAQHAATKGAHREDSSVVGSRVACGAGTGVRTLQTTVMTFQTKLVAQLIIVVGRLAIAFIGATIGYSHLRSVAASACNCYSA